MQRNNAGMVSPKLSHSYTGSAVIYIAIISHGHEDLLIKSRICGLLKTEDSSTDSISIWVKDNKPSLSLKEYCAGKTVQYIDDQPGLGFGDNNNFVFNQIQTTHGFDSRDLFITLNPDIEIDVHTIEQVAERMQSDKVAVATINLFCDHKFTQFDRNVRAFPNWVSAFRMAIGRSVAPPYDKSTVTESISIDWASGAFLAFNPSHYARLSGFDPAYFMYFEDVDICYRSKLMIGETVRYYPDLRAIHVAARNNHNFLSPHAMWFVQSFLRFLFRRYIAYRLSSKFTARPL
jgi:N-acetylglucosaminyl-diphospho-decaprenol L-rhamnosyltransferase